MKYHWASRINKILRLFICTCTSVTQRVAEGWCFGYINRYLNNKGDKGYEE